MILKYLANGLSTFFVKDKPVFSDGSKSLSRNPPDCPILCNWVFENFILAEEPFANALPSFETCVLVNNNLRGKLSSSLEPPITFDENFKLTLVPFFVPNINLLISELDNFDWFAATIF